LAEIGIVLSEDGRVSKEHSPEWNKYFSYLDILRLSGKTNMFGAGVYLEKQFHIDSKLATSILACWMENFGKSKEDLLYSFWD
jgi:hypothetical protein